MSKASILFSAFLGFIASQLLAADLQKRITIESKISVKQSDANISINDIRQNISGYFLLQDGGSIYDEAIGRLSGHYWIIGKSAGGLTSSGSGEFLVFQDSDWACELSNQAKVHVEIAATQTSYDKMGSGRFGYEYYGYLIAVQGADGTLILAKSSRKEFERAVAAFEKLKANTTFNKDLVPKGKVSWLQ
jgi:hypothetical protein